MAEGLPAASIHKEFDKLRQTYLRRLNGSVSELRRMQVMLASPVQPPLSDLQQLYRLSNNFTGSGKTYGFPKISETAKSLNESLKLYLDADSSGPRIATLRRDALYRLELFQSACMAVLRPKLSNDEGEATPLKDRHIAIVNANETLTEFYSHVLQQAGMQIDIVDLASLSKAMADKPDILLVDYDQAPLLSLTLRDLREEGMPVVLAIGKDQAKKAQELAGLVDDFLVKPFSPDMLLLVLKNRLQMVDAPDKP